LEEAVTDTLTKQEPKLSVRKPGHWRNKYWLHPSVPRDALQDDSYIILPNDELYIGRRYPSRELAEEHAFKNIREAVSEGIEHMIRFVCPVFFPAPSHTDGDS
jgi:hypothetical protein